MTRGSEVPQPYRDVRAGANTLNVRMKCIQSRMHELPELNVATGSRKMGKNLRLFIKLCANRRPARKGWARIETDWFDFYVYPVVGRPARKGWARIETRVSFGSWR